MRTIKLQVQRCLVCGSKLVSMDNDESFTCERCGEEYDLEMLSKMELEFSEFDRLLLLDLKMRKRKPHRLTNRIY
jgi:DNA-directed RNA polymerase subunit RPC12/RpoP